MKHHMTHLRTLAAAATVLCIVFQQSAHAGDTVPCVPHDNATTMPGSALHDFRRALETSGTWAMLNAIQIRQGHPLNRTCLGPQTDRTDTFFVSTDDVGTSLWQAVHSQYWAYARKAFIGFNDPRLDDRDRNGLAFQTEVESLTMAMTIALEAELANPAITPFTEMVAAFPELRDNPDAAGAIDAFLDDLRDVRAGRRAPEQAPVTAPEFFYTILQSAFSDIVRDRGWPRVPAPQGAANPTPR